MKIYVYAISKNESKFVERFLRSVSEADGVYVLDTGSTDDTVEKLRAGGAVVIEQTIDPWRFDDARNAALKLLPPDADVAVSVDLDEVFESGWRKEVEKAFSAGANRLTYKYVWSHDKSGGDGVVLKYDKIHSPAGYYWVNPVHEVLETKKGVKTVVKHSDKVVLHHYPDETKSRKEYLGLLELAVKESPTVKRNYFYLGREYYFYKEYDKALNCFKKYLSFSGGFLEEKAELRVYAAKCYIEKGDLSSAEATLLTGIAESIKYKNLYVALCELYSKKRDFAALLFAASRGLVAESEKINYLSDESVKGIFEDYLSIALYEFGAYKQALYYVNAAISKNPLDERLKRNREFIVKELNFK